MQSRVVNVKARDIRSSYNRGYDLYSSKIVKIQRDYIKSSYRNTTNASCQCDIRKDCICTCKKLASSEPRYFSFPKQVYRYTDWRNFTDVGVGSIKALPRKRIRKIYLPETVDRAVGSADLTSYINRIRKQKLAESYYDNKRTSSKCVGRFIENDNTFLISKQLSPMIQKKSGATSPKNEVLKEQNKNIGSYSEQKPTTITQVTTNATNSKEPPKEKSNSSKIKQNPTSKTNIQINAKPTDVSTEDKVKSSVNNNNNESKECKDFSSDSFVQHVHNLENPSYEKQSKMSVDPMENKLEREYRKMFSSKSKEKPSVDKPIPDFKSASLLRRRFEALRRGMGKKDSKKESGIINKPSSHTSMPSRKDVSIASDPPSLEGRSYSNTKVYSPFPSTTHDYKAHPKLSHRKSPKAKKNNIQWPTDTIDSKFESVQGMFKLWGKKFNLEEDACKTSPTISNNVSASPRKELKIEYPPQDAVTKKKQGKRFFFFGKKDKNKENKPYKPKKGVTAGRCEVKDGLVIKVGGAIEPVKETIKKPEKHVEEYDVLRKAWLERFITTTRDSRNSVHIRWNNNMYATSSSTVLELMDSVYKHTGIDFRSRSEITTAESSNYRSFTKQRVHFVHQDVEAWMIPKMIMDKKQRIQTCEKNVPIQISNQKWFVDASKGFSQKIEVVLHAKPNSRSSEYIIINIPDGYFSKSSSNVSRTHSSDEKIYKIVEYDTSDVKKMKENRHMATGDNLVNETKVTVSIQKNGDKEDKECKISDAVIKRPLLLRDVAIQGSNVFVPKRCDVIGVGIITQRDIRDVRKPILKVEDDLSDDSEENLSVKKCELAESYLQDYCRNWMPTGIDTFSWQISDSQLHSSENNSAESLSQGDGSKSCPNMYDDFQGSTIVLSSCETSSCSHCIVLEDEKKPDHSFKCKILKKFKKKSLSEAPLHAEKRYFPKDSVEVLKKRQLYAVTNQKSKWRSADGLNVGSATNVQRSLTNCPRTKPCWRLPDTYKKDKGRAKHVSLPGCEAMSKINDRLSNRSIEGILSYKGSGCNPKSPQSPKRAEVVPKPVCEIPPPPCMESCVQEKKPECTKKNAPPCDQIFQDQMHPESLPPCERNLISRPCDLPPICVKPPKPIKCTTPCRDIYSPSRSKPTSKESLRPELCETPSQQSGLDIIMRPSPKSSPKNSDNCLKTASKKKNSKLKCVDKLVRAMTPPPTPPPTAYHVPQNPPTDCSDYKKMSGLFLKKLPSKKRTNSGVCSSCESDGPGVIRLNSKEKITIRMKKETPSTEEIRQGLNIKVQDEDGQTLYEKIDYKRSGDIDKCVLLKDMYKDPVIRRVSTPITVHDVVAKDNQNEINEVKSESGSVDNLIEINFTLKLKKGDRGTEFNIKNADDTEIKQKAEQGTGSQKDIYIMQDRTDHGPATNNKKDVNIKIVIKNYNTDPDKNNETENFAVLNKHDNDNFTKGISEKFQTVSTGYSNILEHALSAHKTTVDLTTCPEKRKTDNNRRTGSNHSIEDVTKTLMTSSQSVTGHSVTDQTVNLMKYDNDQNSVLSVKNSFANKTGNSTEFSQEDTDNFDGYKSDKNCKEKDKHTDITETSNESILHKKLHLRNKTQKKKMLKKLFQSSSTIKKPENKKKIKEIIKAILTSDSSLNEDTTVTSNELAKEITYDSLGVRFYRDTDSMNNYYQNDSDLSDFKGSIHKKLNPTKNNSECSDNATDVSFENVKRKCMCSTLATKLNLTENGRGGCCCRKTVQKDEEIDCSLENEVYFSNLKSFIDVETQNSKHVSHKINSANLLRSKKHSIVISTASVTIKKSIDIDHATTKSDCYKTFLPDMNVIKSRGMKRFNRDTITDLSEDEILVVNSNLVANSISRSYCNKLTKFTDSSHTADILQLNETKKAVLEIYAEKIVSDDGEKLVAKLPKFDIEKENDISSYEGVFAGRKRISKRNFVMMSING